MNRWWMALMGTALQMCIGTVYAWSYFQNPLAETYGWNNTQVAWVFSTTILFLSLGAAMGGTKLPIYGPRKLAVLGSVLFGSGYLLGALALYVESLPLLYLGYGVVGGTGIGLAYTIGADVDGGIDEVNSSNESKYVDGQPLWDANGKIAKGPNYRRANLLPYLPATITILDK